MVVMLDTKIVEKKLQEKWKGSGIHMVVMLDTKLVKKLQEK